MADTGDLKSPAHKACGFESRQPHRSAPSASVMQGTLFVEGQGETAMNIKGKHAAAAACLPET